MSGLDQIVLAVNEAIPCNTTEQIPNQSAAQDYAKDAKDASEWATQGEELDDVECCQYASK